MPVSKEFKNAVVMWLGIIVLLFITQKVNQVWDKTYDDGFPPRVEYGNGMCLSRLQHRSAQSSDLP